MRVHIYDLADGTHAAILLRNLPDPTQNVVWRSENHFSSRDEAYRVAVTVARLEFGVLDLAN